MKPKNILDALNGVDFDLVEQAAEKPPVKKPSRLKWGAIAACAALVIGVGALLLFGQNSPLKTPKTPRDTSNGRWSTDGRCLLPVSGEIAMEWPWEYKTPMERYPGVTLNGVTYGTRAREIGEALLGEALGTCTATGYDVYTETSYPAQFEVRAIRGVDPEQLVAVELEGTWVVFLREGLPIPATLGDWMDACSLPENLRLEAFCTKEGYETTGWYLAESDETVWQVLSECRNAPGSTEDWDLGDRKYISFTVTSEALGVYKQVLSVTEDGYLLTNLMEYGYVFEIGEDAAGRIIRSVTEHCRETEAEPYYPMLGGTLTEIGDGYILVDDTPLCANEEDGLVYKVLLDDPRASRCLKFPGDIDPGDFVVVEYSGTIDTAHENTVTGAFSIAEAIFMGGGEPSGAENPEGTEVGVTQYGFGIPE